MMVYTEWCLYFPMLFSVILDILMTGLFARNAVSEDLHTDQYVRKIVWVFLPSDLAEHVGTDHLCISDCFLFCHTMLLPTYTSFVTELQKSDYPFPLPRNLLLILTSSK